MSPDEVERLGTQGWFARKGFAGAASAAPVALARAKAGLFAPAGVSHQHLRDEKVRTDELLWIPAEDVELGELYGAFENLRLELNQDAWLGLTRFELQLAHYSTEGGHYQKHRDAFERANQRRVTAIVYLNPHWRPSDGGLLVLHTEPPAEIEPRLGQLVAFLSGKVEHEVLPTHARRLAATAWYYGN